MKNLILFVLFVSSLTVLNNQHAYGAIPIQHQTENVSKDATTKTFVKESKVKKAVTKHLGKRLADDSKILSIVLAILIPFVGVAVWQNGITKDFWITLLLTLLLYLPGLIYALYVILGDK